MAHDLRHHANNALGAAVVLAMALAGTLEVDPAAEQPVTTPLRWLLGAGMLLAVVLHLLLRRRARRDPGRSEP